MRASFARWLGLAVLVIGLPYLVIIGIAAFDQRSTIYHPTLERGTPPADFQEIRVTTSDGDIAGWYRPAAAHQPTVLFFDGNAGSLGRASGVTTPLARAGYGLLLASYPGYDGNPGKPSEKCIYETARAFAAWLETQNVSDVVVLGYSLGSGAATQIASERRVRALILLAPFASLANVGAHHMPHLPVKLLLLDRFDNATRIADVQAPVLIVHGDADEVVPIAEGRNLFALARHPKTFVTLPDTGHGIALERVMPDITALIARQ